MRRRAGSSQATSSVILLLSAAIDLSCTVRRRISLWTSIVSSLGTMGSPFIRLQRRRESGPRLGIVLQQGCADPQHALGSVQLAGQSSPAAAVEQTTTRQIALSCRTRTSAERSSRAIVLLQRGKTTGRHIETLECHSEYSCLSSAGFSIYDFGERVSEQPQEMVVADARCSQRS